MRGDCGVAATNLWVVSHDVVETGQQAQAGADLHVHGAVHVVEEVQRLVNQLAALLQEPWGGGAVGGAETGSKSALLKLMALPRFFIYVFIFLTCLAGLWPGRSGRSGRRRRLWG